MKHLDSAIHARLDSLEKQNGRLRAAVAAMALCIAAAIALGAASQNGMFGTLTAERLNIVDSNGKTVISLGVGELGTGVAVYENDGSLAALFGKSNAEQAGSLALFDSEGRARVGMGLDGGTPSIAIADESGRKLIGLGGATDRYGVLVMDQAGNERAALGIVRGDSICALADDKGIPQIAMARNAPAGYRFVMLDDAGKQVTIDD